MKISCLNLFGSSRPKRPCPLAVPAMTALLLDENLPDGSRLRPGTKFIKYWKMKNSGRVCWDSETKVHSSTHIDTHLHTQYKTCKTDCLFSTSVEVHVGEPGSGLWRKMAGGGRAHTTARSGGCGQCGPLCSDVRGHLHFPLAPSSQRRAVWTTCLVQHRCGSTCTYSHLCRRAAGVSLCHPAGKTTTQRHPYADTLHSSRNV